MKTWIEYANPGMEDWEKCPRYYQLPTTDHPAAKLKVGEEVVHHGVNKSIQFHFRCVSDDPLVNAVVEENKQLAERTVK